jgi:hypothetical protein
MPLQRLDPYTMSLDDCARCWDEWKEFHDEMTDFVQAFPNRWREAHANWKRAWHAAHDGVMLSERAANALVDQEIEDAPVCPYEPNTETWST